MHRRVHSTAAGLHGSTARAVLPVVRAAVLKREAVRIQHHRTVVNCAMGWPWQLFLASMCHALLMVDGRSGEFGARAQFNVEKDR